MCNLEKLPFVQVRELFKNEEDAFVENASSFLCELSDVDTISSKINCFYRR